MRQIAMLGATRQIGGPVHAELHDLLPAAVTLSAWPSRAGAFPATPVERDIQALGHLDAGLRAAAGGVAAAVIDSVGDYGLAALRAALAIPVAGAGESGLTAAARHGRFAIVTVWPVSMNFVPRDLLRLQGLEARCTGIHNVGDGAVLGELAGPDGYLARIHRAEQTVCDRVVEAVNRAAAEGAGAVMLGCTCMSAMAARVAAAAPIPVINPLAAAVQSVLAQGAPPAAPEPAIRTGRAAQIIRMIDAIAGEEDESCPVCVAAEPD